VSFFIKGFKGGRRNDVRGKGTIKGTAPNVGPDKTKNNKMRGGDENFEGEKIGFELRGETDDLGRKNSQGGLRCHKKRNGRYGVVRGGKGTKRKKVISSDKRRSKLGGAGSLSTERDQNYLI